MGFWQFQDVPKNEAENLRLEQNTTGHAWLNLMKFFFEMILCFAKDDLQQDFEF